MDEPNVRTQTSTCSDSNSDEGTRAEAQLPLDERICLVGSVVDDEEACRAAQQFGVAVVSSETGLEYVDDVSCKTVFVLQDFDSPQFKQLHKSSHRILGSVALKQIAERKEKLPSNTRPLYNLAMFGLVICFTGFRKKEDLTKIIPLIHHMGGSIRKDMVAKVTHLIATSCGGDKYQYATTFKVPVMSQDWVTTCWDNRDDLTLCATNENLIADNKLKPFFGARVCFLGFSSEETKHMQEVLTANGGTVAKIDDPLCTHVVMESGNTFNLLSSISSPSPIPSPEPPSEPPPLEIFETPNKRRLSSPDEPESIIKRRRNTIFLNESLGKRKLKEILKTPLDLFSRRRSVTALNETIDSQCFSTPNEKFKFKSPAATPKSKSLFKKDFRKSFILKNITEYDPNCSMDDVDVSVCENVRVPLNQSVSSSYSIPISLNSHEADGQDGISGQLSAHGSARVVDESNVKERPEGPSPKALLVKAEWFWASVQNVACADEREYLFDEYLECVLSPGRRDSHAATPSSSSRRKRKRLQETLSSLVRNDSPSLHKRRSSVSDAGLLSVSGSFLDCTTSPDKDQPEGTSVDTPRKNPRQQVFMELVQTEFNYVNILKTIMTMFKSHLEEMPESEALLNNTELKIIFGNVPPIYETHTKMLEELRWASSHWTDETSIGNIILKYANDLLKAYPPFVNFFETMKEMLVQCDQNKPRFHAFLKVCQTRPECGRQGLQDLLIRPVQRLPSISLLLNDILKHTPNNNPDHAALQSALSAIKEVMTHINEDKRKTEGQRVMFDIFNEIDKCPADLVSSHRSFITRCEVVELSDQLSGRGNSLMLFLFSDQLEVCKKRSKSFNTLKSPNSVNGFTSNKNVTKPFKHVTVMPLNFIKRVIDIRETDVCQRVFALAYRDQELKDKLLSFTITDPEQDKEVFLKTLCRQLANYACTADADNFLASVEPEQLDIETSDVNTGTLSKAFKFASRTRIKVGRAFSFNKTPNKLKRAMSTMMSPFGNATASQLANMRLASCNNINELGSTTDSSEAPGNESLMAPMSVQPTRKVKCSSLNVAAMKRL